MIFHFTLLSGEIGLYSAIFMGAPVRLATDGHSCTFVFRYFTAQIVHQRDNYWGDIVKARSCARFWRKIFDSPIVGFRKGDMNLNEGFDPGTRRQWKWRLIRLHIRLYYRVQLDEIEKLDYWLIFRLMTHALENFRIYDVILTRIRMAAEIMWKGYLYELESRRVMSRVVAA